MSEYEKQIALMASTIYTGIYIKYIETAERQGYDPGWKDQLAADSVIAAELMLSMSGGKKQ